MTMLNATNDGLYPELIVLARTVVHSKSISREELIGLCAAGDKARLAAQLSRWTSLGLFVENSGAISIDRQFGPKRGQPLDEWTDQLAALCRQLILTPTNCQPLFGDSAGTSADIVAGVAWLLAQDIFSLPNAWDGVDGIEAMELGQVKGVKILQNNTRWNPLRYWARYLGFACGDGRNFIVDPTVAIRAELPRVFESTSSMAAESFVRELATRLPVLDAGTYRNEVESKLDKTLWREPSSRHLSMSMSYALRRLKLDQAIDLETRADAPGAYLLTGMGYRSLESFTHVRLIGERA